MQYFKYKEQLPYQLKYCNEAKSRTKELGEWGFLLQGLLHIYLHIYYILHKVRGVDPKYYARLIIFVSYNISVYR